MMKRWLKQLDSEEKLASNASVFLREMKKKKEEGTLVQVWKDWKWIFSYTRKYKWAVVFYIVTGILSTTLTLVSAVASKYTIDIITGYKTSLLWVVIVVMVVSMAVSLILNSVTNRISARLAIDISNDIQGEIFDVIADADWLSLNDFSNGDLLNRFNTDIQSVANNAINWLPTIIVSLYQFISTFCVIWYYSPIMACIALSSAPLLLLLSRFVLKRQRNYYKEVRRSSSDVMAYEVEAFSNLDTIKSFGLSKLYGANLRVKLEAYKETVLTYNAYTIVTNVALSLLSSLVEYAAFGYCLWQLWSHQITFGTMTLFLTQRSSLTSAFNKVISIIPNILTASVSASRIRELTELPCEQHRGELSESFGKEGVQVCLSDLQFGYEPQKPVLEQADFEASPGEIVALIGPSGEGKTTLIRLILGLVYPQSGQAYIQTAGRKYPMNADLRSLFSYVPQGNTILSGTIADNLRMVKQDATDDELQQALKQACAWEFVSQMKDGMYSKLGEKGRGLSEGQAQRIAIARAVLRDAPILLLDEATSALDTVTERKILKNIIQQDSRKTIIVTTHRPSVLNLCQKVYRIERGHLVILDEISSSQMVIDF